MKFLLFAVVLAVTSASSVSRSKSTGGDYGYVFGSQFRRSDGIENLHNPQQYYSQGYDNGILPKMESVYGKQEVYENTELSQILRQVLTKFFDKEFLLSIPYKQGVYEQSSLEKICDRILAYEGVFDKEYLIYLVRNPLFRQILIRYGIFNAFAVKQFLSVANTQSSFEYSQVETLVNKKALKYWLLKENLVNEYFLRESFVKHGHGYISENIDSYGPDYLIAVFKNIPLRNTLVEYGIFNKYVLEKIEQIYSIQGIYSPVLLKQLINKEVLLNFLEQYGVDRTNLKYSEGNEIYALNIFLKFQFFQQTPRFSYKQIVGFTSPTPEFNFINQHPFESNYYRKSAFEPYRSIFYPSFYSYGDKYASKFDVPLSVVPVYPENYLRNIIYRQAEPEFNYKNNAEYYMDYKM